MNTAYITVGISGSGKSTWAKQRAKEHGHIITNRDDLRFSLTGASGWDEYKFSFRTEEIVSEIQLLTIQEAAKRNKGIIIADTNLSFRTRNKMVALCESLGFLTCVIPFEITLEEAYARNETRGNFKLPTKVLDSQWEKWQEYLKETT